MVRVKDCEDKQPGMALVSRPRFDGFQVLLNLRYTVNISTRRAPAALGTIEDFPCPKPTVSALEAISCRGRLFCTS